MPGPKSIKIPAPESLKSRDMNSSYVSVVSGVRIRTISGTSQNKNSAKNVSVRSEAAFETPPVALAATPETPPLLSEDVPENNHEELSETQLGTIVEMMYEEIVYWRKNLFKLPSGAAGKRYIRELTRLIKKWIANHDSLFEFSFKMAMCMPAILLQKPGRKSTAKQHTEYLKKRLDLWEAGKFNELLTEARYIQKKMQNNKKYDTPEHIAKTFAKLMLQGKVNAALKLLNKAANLGIADFKLGSNAFE